jgi:hypothetical protein
MLKELQDLRDEEMALKKKKEKEEKEKKKKV